METRRCMRDVSYFLLVGYFVVVVTASVVRPLETAGTSGEEALLTASATPDITCTAPPVTTGETASIICSFHKNAYGSKIKIRYYGNEQKSKEQDILECYTDVDGKYNCDNKETQYSLEGNVSDTVHLTFKADKSREGIYTCFLLPSSENPSVGCSFNLSSQAHNVSLGTAEARTGDKEEAILSTGTIVVIVVAVIGTTILIVVGLLCYYVRWRKRRDDVENSDSVSLPEVSPLATSSN